MDTKPKRQRKRKAKAEGDDSAEPQPEKEKKPRAKKEPKEKIVKEQRIGPAGKQVKYVAQPGKACRERMERALPGTGCSVQYQQTRPRFSAA